MSDYRFFVALHEAGMPTSAQRSLVTEFRGAVLTVKFGRNLRNGLTLIGPNISTFDLMSCAVLTAHSHSALHGSRATEACVIKAHPYNFPAGTEEDHVNIN
jgi:hypothetical protein